MKKKTQVFESYEEINFCKNEFMRKQTLEQASFFYRRVPSSQCCHKEQWCTKSSRTLLKHQIKSQFLLTYCKMWEGNMGKGWERHCMFNMTLICLWRHILSDEQYVYYLLKLWTVLYNDFSRPSFTSETNQLLFLIML